MATVAEQLRRAREGQKLDVYQVAEITKIKADHIRALEAGDYETFSAQVYVRGFVRSYARLLKLDPSPLSRQLDSELVQIPKFRELPSLTGQPKGFVDVLLMQLAKLNWRIVAAVVALALVILVIVSGFRRMNRTPRAEPTHQLGPGLYQPSQDTGDMLPLPGGAA
jgi:cytoskeletal protein RodZ